MVTESDVALINEALEQGYEVRIRLTRDGYKIVAEKVKAKVLKDSKK